MDDENKTQGLGEEKRDDFVIDGQIDISELFYRNYEYDDEKEDEERDGGLVDGQIGFDNILEDEDNMKKKDDKKELLSKMSKGLSKDDRDLREQALLSRVSSGGKESGLKKVSSKVDSSKPAPKKVTDKEKVKKEKSSTSKKSGAIKTTKESTREKALKVKKEETRGVAKKAKKEDNIGSKKVDKLDVKASKNEIKLKQKKAKESLEKSKTSVSSLRSTGTKKGENSTKNTSKRNIEDEDTEFDIEDIFDIDARAREEIKNLNRGVGEVEVSRGKDVFGGIKTIKKTDVEKTYFSDTEEIVDGMLYKTIDTVLHESMIPYSEHVILDRALPRVEDGLKPVQRRILYDMFELGNTPDKPYKKSARIVGDCLGKYHPHGDSSVYDAMVRLAQPFNCNEVLVDGHGNFGSIDGDDAAAMRYTEARLSPLALELLRDLDKNTVRWGLNFDDSLKEPEMLPGRFPNLLVNGSTGIAVGLATNIPPHNLGETIDGVVAYIKNPKITLKEMLKIIKGPDFPTGGYILSSSELYEAYSTGRGKIYMRAKMHIEDGNDGKKSIVITELPYQVNKAVLLQKIATLKEEERYNLTGIQDVRDESDREGIRAVIKLKKDASVKKIYNSLLKNTDLQGTFGVNMVAIANGKPKQMGLLDIISYYAEYQREVVLRRTKYDLEQALERAHILEGLIIAIRNIDAVVKIIKTSENTSVAKTRLKEKFKLSDRQAQAILDMRLARLTSLEVYKLEEELKELERLIKAV